jgi:formate dehydrogenase major subunit
MFEVKAQQAVYLALGDDYASQRLIRRFEHVPFKVVQASYHSPATAIADLILPSEMWAEQEGHYLNLEGRLQASHRGLNPPAEVRGHVEIINAIAGQLNLSLDGEWRAGLNKRMPMNRMKEE